MKWIVFALGFALGFGGLAAILQGYDIVQIERGWTLVISGATALSAGIVTIALGFVIARIETLIAVSGQERSALPVYDRAPAPLAEAPVVAAPLDVAAAGAPVASPPPVSSETMPANPFFAGRESFAAADVGRRQEANLSDFAFKKLGFRLPPKAVREPVMPGEPVVPAAAPPASPPAGAPKVRPRAAFTLPPRVPTKSIPVPGPWPSGPASTTAEPQVPAQAAQVPRNDEHDWLEQALAGIETDENVGPAPASEEAQRTAEPPAVPEEEPAAAAIVGRYEANGASYALFADGSIEAETDSGTYRFASMAELKKFIDGGA
jgi:hypothetical protein